MGEDPNFTQNDQNGIVDGLSVASVRKHFESAYSRKDSDLVIVAECVGQTCYTLKDTLSAADKKWFLDFFTSLVLLESPTSASTDMKADIGVVLMKEVSVADRCRKWCAYNLPAMLLTTKSCESFPVDSWLTPILRVLSQDTFPSTRLHLAAGFHEVCSLLDVDVPAVRSTYLELLSTVDIAVLEACFSHLDQCLSYIFKYTNASNANQANRHSNELIGKLVACNAVLKESTNWRPHERYLKQMADLAKYLSADEVNLTLLPMIQNEVLTARPLPCRHASIQTILTFLLYTKKRWQRTTIIDKLISDLCLSRSCHKRMLYLDLCQIAGCQFSRSFVVKHFLLPAFRLSNDRVSNVRIKLCKMLPYFRSLFSLPRDQHLMNRLESVVEKFRRDEKCKDLSSTLQEVEKILTDSCHPNISDIEDRERLEKECVLFGEPMDRFLLSRERSTGSSFRAMPDRPNINGSLPRKPTNVVHPVEPDFPRELPSKAGSESAIDKSSVNDLKSNLNDLVNKNKPVEDADTDKKSEATNPIYPSVSRSRARIAVVRPQQIHRRPPSPRPPVSVASSDGKEKPAGTSPSQFYGLQRSSSFTEIPSNTKLSGNYHRSMFSDFPSLNPKFSLARTNSQKSIPSSLRFNDPLRGSLERLDILGQTNADIGKYSRNFLAAIGQNAKLPPQYPKARKPIHRDRFDELLARFESAPLASPPSTKSNSEISNGSSAMGSKENLAPAKPDQISIPSNLHSKSFTKSFGDLTSISLNGHLDAERNLRWITSKVRINPSSVFSEFATNSFGGQKSPFSVIPSLRKSSFSKINRL